MIGSDAVQAESSENIPYFKVLSVHFQLEKKRKHGEADYRKMLFTIDCKTETAFKVKLNGEQEQYNNKHNDDNTNVTNHENGDEDPNHKNKGHVL